MNIYCKHESALLKARKQKKKNKKKTPTPNPQPKGIKKICQRKFFKCTKNHKTKKKSRKYAKGNFFRVGIFWPRFLPFSGP